MLTSLMSDLAPEGILEETFATEIMGATWRLRRCRLIEEAFGAIDDLDFDPALDDRTEKQQRSVDRARAQSHLILRRSIAELRKLQTQRAILAHVDDPDIPRMADLKQVASTLKMEDSETEQPSEPPTPKLTMDDLEAMMGMSDAQLRQAAYPNGSSFCRPTAAPPAQPTTAPRNAPCPCGSGAKFKRCCGRTGAGWPNGTANSPAEAVR